MDFVSVCKIEEIPKNGMKGFVVNGKKILIAELNGKYYAITSQCTHMRGPLDRGRIEGTEVVCPWHGSRFDLTTGKATGGPAVRDEEKLEVKAEKGQVWVGV